MMSKSFLSGMFSVVSFVLISTFVTPSTFAQCPQDVSGEWIVKIVDDRECCSNPENNGRYIMRERHQTTQIGNEISASWVSDNGDTLVLTGIVNGNSVYYKIVRTFSNNPSCGAVVHTVGFIKGNRIECRHTAAATCGGCKTHGKTIIKIVK